MPQHTFSCVSPLLLAHLTAKQAVAFAWHVSRDSNVVPPAHRHTNLLCNALFEDDGSQIIKVVAHAADDDTFGQPQHAACALCDDISHSAAHAAVLRSPQMTLCASAVSLLPPDARVLCWRDTDVMNIVSVPTAAHFGNNDFCVCKANEVDAALLEAHYTGPLTLI